MRINFFSIFLIFFSIPLLIGCQTAHTKSNIARSNIPIPKVTRHYCACENILPTEDELKNAKYGDPIDQIAVKKEIESAFMEILKDPYSAKKEWGSFKKAWMRDTPANGCNIHFGYTAALKINSKNGFGAYTGYETRLFFFKNGSIFSIDELNSDGDKVYYGCDGCENNYEKC